MPLEPETDEECIAPHMRLLTPLSKTSDFCQIPPNPRLIVEESELQKDRQQQLQKRLHLAL